jgi:hypothetical protein
MAVTAIRSRPAIFDWEADEDGDISQLDLSTAFAVLDNATERCVRDAARKIRRHFATQGLVVR